jgi:hypothetical protein
MAAVVACALSSLLSRHAGRVAPVGRDGGLEAVAEDRIGILELGSQATLRWRGLDSNFQYAGAVNLVVAPFVPPNARDGSVRPLSFRTARRPQSGVDPTAEAAIRAGDAQRPNFAWFGKKTATLYRVTAPADPVLVHGNRLGGAKGPQPVPLQCDAPPCGPPPWNAGPRLWTAGTPWSPSGNPIWSVAISTHSMAFSGSAPPTVAGGPGFCGT